MATRPTRPKGYLTKGKTKSINAARKSAARKELTSLKGIAGLVGRSVVEGIGGPKAKAAGVAVRAGKKALSGKALDAAINKANLSARSTKPVRSKSGGLKTTTGQGRKKVSSVAATRMAEQSAGPKARRLGGEAALRSKGAKPGVRITTKAGKYRGYGTLSKEKTTVTKPVKLETNKKGSAITVRKTEPRKAADVRAERAKIRRDRLREALTPRINPARKKITPERSKNNTSGFNAREQELIDRYYRIRFGDKGGPTPRSAQELQSSIESRIASGAEKPTRGSVNNTGDKEATILAQRSMRALNSPKAASQEKVKPGKPTKTTIGLRMIGSPKGVQAAKLKGTIRNQRKVLREREIKEAAERIRKAEEAAKKRGTK